MRDLETFFVTGTLYSMNYAIFPRFYPALRRHQYFAEPLVGLCISAPSHSKSKFIHPHESDANDELFVYGRLHHKIWHNQWWNPFATARFSSTPLIFSFFPNT
jgi:hypothetical protein